ncbi:MAG: class I SAM-dependent methyltransferase [Bacteroidales bacterium]
MASVSKLLKSAFTTGGYYQAMNTALKRLEGKYQMLHYPFQHNENESFEQAQENLINYCVNFFPGLKDKSVLDLGCGNGTVSFYLAENFDAGRIVGVDINSNNVEIARAEKIKNGMSKVEFFEDDAQNLSQITDNSFDYILNIESAFHYPDKYKFLNELHRVLKPGGHFIIADIVHTRKNASWFNSWKKKMNFNHWSLDDYVEAVDQKSLHLITKNDVSPEVINGFKKYRSYLNDSRLKENPKDWVLKFFFMVNVKLNIYLLKNKRRYYVFYGRKAE